MLAKSFFTVSGFTLLSRISGFVRDIFMAAILGAGPLAEVFLVAFKLPNFFRRLFAEGAFNAAFVPMFSGILAADGQEKAKAFAEQIFSMLLASLLLFVAVMEIAMPWVMWGLAPGFADDAEKFALAVELTRVTFPYLLFISLVSLFAGVLNSVGRFAAVAAAPILLNLCLIAALLWLVEYTETPAHALSYGVAIAGLVQFLWLLLACKQAGMVLKLRLPKLDARVKEFLRKMAPGILGAGVVQINLWVDVIIGTFIPSAIAYLYYADRVNQLPLSIIGTAMGTALLPMLSKHIRSGEQEKAMYDQNRALELVLFFALPATAALMVIAYPIISVLFERGEFGTDAALATSYGLMAYAVGLPAFVMVKIFSTTFFAVGDTKTPVRIAIIAMVTNVVLNIGLVLLFMEMGVMPHIGLALATAFASWLNVALLVRKLAAEGKFTADERLQQRSRRMLAAVLVMVTVLYSTQQMLALGVASLIILVLAGAGSYFTTAHILRAFEVAELRGFLGRKD